MTFPCLICGELPVVPEQTGNSAFSLGGGGRLNNNNNNSTPSSSFPGTGKRDGPTIRTLSKDVSDKIFQTICRHLYVKPEPYWFIQNPGEQMPLCANCSAVVLEVYTLQTKIDQFQAMIKRHVWKLERIVADTEIACNWMATREEQESEEAMWNEIPCPPLAIKIARERHKKFRFQVLQNFKNKVKLRQKMRSTGQHGDDMSDIEPFGVNTSEPIIDEQDSQPLKRPRRDDSLMRNRTQVTQRASPPVLISVSSVRNSKMTTPVSAQQQDSDADNITLQSTSSQMQSQFVDESEASDDQNPQIYPSVQIVCPSGEVEFLKEEYDYSNSGDGEDNDGSFWNSADMSMDADDNYDEDDDTTIPEGEDVVWLAPGVPLRKTFIEQLQTERPKPSVFLRKLLFAVFGLKRIANASGISGSNKAGAKPSLDRFKFEALREYTIDSYGIRDNPAELEDLNRKIRTICCDARKTMKRRVTMKPVTSCTLESFPTASSSGGLLEQSVTGNTKLFEFEMATPPPPNSQTASVQLEEATPDNPISHE